MHIHRFLRIASDVNTESVCKKCPYKMYRAISSTASDCKHFLQEGCELQKYLVHIPDGTAAKKIGVGDICFTSNNIFVRSSAGWKCV